MTLFMLYFLAFGYMHKWQIDLFYSGLPFCRAFVVMNFHSESVVFFCGFLCEFFFCGFLCVIFFLWIFGTFCPLNKRRTENPQREIHSKIHTRRGSRVSPPPLPPPPTLCTSTSRGSCVSSTASSTTGCSFMERKPGPSNLLGRPPWSLPEFHKSKQDERSEQLPCRSAEVKIFSVFLCQRCREIWREILVKFSVLRFPGFGCARENFTKISRPKRCEKRIISHKFHSAEEQR